MSSNRSIPWPGTGRITLALLAVVPAVMAYPWHSARSYWLIGIAAAVAILLFGWWRGLYFTTILRRRLAMMRRKPSTPGSATDVRTAVVLRVEPLASDRDVLPLPLLARYLHCYGIRADTVRITSRTNGSGELSTWIGLTMSAADNLAALRARSARIPLHDTAQVTARRLADHLREIGWEVTTVAADDVPQVVVAESRETWRAVRQGDSDFVAAYRVSVDDALAERLDEVRSNPALETWTALEIADPSRSGTRYTVAAACAFRTDTPPDGAAPLNGLTLQRGSQLPALMALWPSSTQRLDGHTDAPAGLLTRVVWPNPAAGAHREQLTSAATQAASQA
ncbi:type VII secretion protein EccE [Mycobacterium basiliense]|uniref:Type VII secretion protein EccE n=1 Tax=Mycobacterium basiliense TaxID=2094119 RepID=A0A3S4DQR3_9MYCO|nr:type VII secretion protein EccE [Mycobacterium basiliense]VDM86931.1 type VII secretion protein EccE [Mycobacterium basiliense]